MCYGFSRKSFGPHAIASLGLFFVAWPAEAIAGAGARAHEYFVTHRRQGRSWSPPVSSFYQLTGNILGKPTLLNKFVVRCLKIVCVIILPRRRKLGSCSGFCRHLAMLDEMEAVV